MTRTAAITILQRMYKRPFWRVGDRRSSPDLRFTHRAQQRDLKDALTRCDAEYNAWLSMQPEHQRWRTARAELARQRAQLDIQPYYKFQVGYDGIIGRHITGEGDTWEEAIAAAKTNKTVYE